MTFELNDNKITLIIS